MSNAADAAHDPEVLRLENMDTDLPPPQAAILATHQALDSDACNSYLPFLGQDALRKAAARHVSNLSGVSYDWESQCIISAGGTNGILNTLLALLEPGDEVILTDPIYVGLLNRVRLAGGVPRLVPLLPGRKGWRLDLSALGESVSSKTRLLLMASASLPTGAVPNREEWEAIAEVCKAANAWLLYDAAMGRILFDDAPYIHPASLEGMSERTITVGAVSKEYRMIGWRVGWIIGPGPVMNDIGLVSMANVVCQVGIAMPGAAAALTTPDDGLKAAVAHWQTRRDVVLEELSDLPVVPSNGGWSLLLDVNKLGMNSEEASRLLFEKGKVAATPMTHWGSERASAYLRLVYSNEPVNRLRGLRERARRAWNV
jgi:N-succinyldiaminopimelate aminotransferase